MPSIEARDTLFLAATRPAMKWGVPMEGYYINLFGTFVVGMVLGSPLWWGLFVVFHWPMVGLANHNPNFFHELRMWFLTRGQVIGGVLHVLRDRGARHWTELSSGV
jgi:type IV secretion system protein VirB3